MRVDPEILRAFAGQVDSAAADIGAADVGGKTSSAGDALPGSTTQMTRLSPRATTTRTAVRGAGDTFEVADDALAGQFDGLF